MANIITESFYEYRELKLLIKYIYEGIIEYHKIMENNIERYNENKYVIKRNFKLKEVLSVWGISDFYGKNLSYNLLATDIKDIASLKIIFNVDDFIKKGLVSDGLIKVNPNNIGFNFDYFLNKEFLNLDEFKNFHKNLVKYIKNPIFFTSFAHEFIHYYDYLNKKSLRKDRVYKSDINKIDINKIDYKKYYQSGIEINAYVMSNIYKLEKKYSDIYKNIEKNNLKFDIKKSQFNFILNNILKNYEFFLKKEFDNESLSDLFYIMKKYYDKNQQRQIIKRIYPFYLEIKEKFQNKIMEMEKKVKLEKNNLNENVIIENMTSLIVEELTNSDINQIKNLSKKEAEIVFNSFEKELNKKIMDMLEKDEKIDKVIKEKIKKSLSNLFKTLWDKKSTWQGDL